MTYPIRSTIDRRLLVNVRLDPDVARRLLPWPLRPQLVRGWAVAGVCFLRLRDVRPRGLPAVGLASENAAHRLAVEWEGGDGPTSGVFVPRRDTSSRLAALLGGRVLEGELSAARFEIHDAGGRLSIRVQGRGGHHVEVTARTTASSESALFGSIEEQSRFFQDGRVAYSPNRRRDVIEAVALEGAAWIGTPMVVEHFCSSVFQDEAAFPPGSWRVDSGMLIRNVTATWHPAAPLERGATASRTADSVRS